MKKWIITIVIGVALLAVGVTHPYWLRPFLEFLRVNKDTIDALSTLADLLGKIGGPIVSLLGYLGWRKERKSSDASKQVTINQANASNPVAVADGHVEGPVIGGQAKVGDVVAGDKHEHTHIHQPATQPATALHQLPSPPGDFTGRQEELDELLGKVEAGGVAISGLQGKGGVGKTALALVLAERLAPRYPDAQFYLDLKGASPQPLSPAEALGHVIRSYHPEEELPEDAAQLGKLYRHLLHDKRTILLMDNASDAAQVQPLIPPAGSILLVTSRNHFALPGIHAKNLDQLPPADARKLLLRIAERIGDHAAAIAEKCGYLPIALRAAGSTLAETIDLSPEDYLRRLEDAKTRLGLVEATFRLSYDLLTPESQQKFRGLAVFPDTFHRISAAAVWGVEDDVGQDTLSQIVKLSLLDYSPATGRYRLHDLVRDFANSCLPESEQSAAQRRHAEHYLGVLRAVGNLYKKGGESVMLGLGLFDLERTNVQSGQAWAASHAGEDETAARLCSAYPGAGAHFLNLRQHPREQIAWLKAALSAARMLKGQAAEGVHLGNLGTAYAMLGDTHRAIEFFEQSLAINREIGNRRGEGANLGNLGTAYGMLGDTRRAIEFHEQNLVVAREIGDRRSEGNALGSLGIAYMALGETQRAIEFHEQDLLIAREIGDRRGEGDSLGNLGLAYKDLGETSRAIEYYQQQLTIVREIGDRRGEGNALGNLGNAYYLLGETRRAIECHEQALAISREIGDRRGEGNDEWNMALALDKLGQRLEAIPHAERALAIYEQIEDPTAPKVRAALAEWRK